MTSFSPFARHRQATRRPYRPARMLAGGAALAFGWALTAAAWAGDADRVIARVNGTDIKASDLTLADEDIGSNLPMTGEPRRDYLTRYLIDMQLIVQAADAKKLGDNEEFQRRLSYARSKLLMERYLQTQGKAAVTDAALRELYQQVIKEMAGEQEIHARHILVGTEDDAKAVFEQLRKGADFAALAKERSKDPSSSEGGDLGYFTRDRMVPEFADAAFKLQVGQISDPVKTEFGWHIIKLEDKRNRPIPEFDKVKDQLENMVARKALSEQVAKLRADAKIERLEPPPAAAPDAEAAGKAAK
jgi:peptidyl-prolyl cis-trans isomerase C